MGIDLEQPSGEHHKEVSRHSVDTDLVDGVDEGNSGNEAANSYKVIGKDKENAGPNTNAESSDCKNREYTGHINLNSSKNLEPPDGMEFGSKEEAFSFYKEYAKSVGFSAIIKASRRSRISGKFIDAKFACTRYGNKREPDEAETSESLLRAGSISSVPIKRKRGRVKLSWAKTDCKASMHVKRRQDGRWTICSFIKEHNHEILPDHAYYLWGHRNLDLGNGNVDALHAVRARKGLYATMSRKSGEHKKVDKQKGSSGNQSDNRQHLALDEGDVRAMLDHFMNMQDENPNFFYAIDLNEEQQLRNVFWVDAKGRLDYRSFDDVVLFDTTHIKNEYKLPYIPFIGVNHHFQFMLLGCALVSNESKSTYTWLMQAWFRAMGGQAPRVILTDQDKALKEAVGQVLPGSRHCFCLWHIMSKIPEKLSHITRQHENFMIKFKKCILKSWTNEQFQKRWWKMVEQFNLGDDKWLLSIYEDCGRWVPTYMKDTFLAGMSTLQRSDTLNCILDKYMQRKTTLTEFLEQYKVILQEKCEEEAKADFETFHKQPALKSPSPFGKQMVTLYTHTIFKKFQNEVLGVVACHPRKESEDGSTKLYRVQDFENNQDFIVTWDGTTSDISCSCCSFQFYGFLCRHVMIVLQISGVHSIPSQYILKRWTKNAKNRQTERKVSDMVDSRVKRYSNLCQQALELGDEGSLSQESYNVAVNALEEALRKCESIYNSTQSVIELSSPFFGSQDENLISSAVSTNKKISTSKKRQIHPEKGITTIGIDNHWQQTENSNARAAGLASSESEQCIQEMDQLNSRSQILDGLLATQQIVSGMGQLNSIAASHNDYYRNQHEIQGLGQLNPNAPIIDAHNMTPQRVHGMDQSNGGPNQLHVMVAKQLHSRHLSQ